MYATTQENYQKATAKLVDVTNAMAEISFNLTKLTGDNMTLVCVLSHKLKVVLTF